MDSKEAIHYFEKLNRLHTERLADLLSTQQHNVVSLLSFLFHTNIQGLPGFVDKNIVAGIIDFQADKDCLQLVQKLFPSIKYKHRPLRHYPITGLYLVNHHGLLHISAQAHFSLYLVCSSRLKEAQREGLQQKLAE
jgi:adenylate cyclase class 1